MIYTGRVITYNHNLLPFHCLCVYLVGQFCHCFQWKATLERDNPRSTLASKTLPRRSFNWLFSNAKKPSRPPPPTEPEFVANPLTNLCGDGAETSTSCCHPAVSSSTRMSHMESKPSQSQEWMEAWWVGFFFISGQFTSDGQRSPPLIRPFERVCMKW